jgi:squalene/phytoene synthase
MAADLDTARLSPDQRVAVAFLPADQRQGQLALAVIWGEIGAIPQRCSDAQVARTRLDWWQRELTRYAQGQPQHPATRSLAAAAPTALFDGLGDDLIAAIDLEISDDGSADDAALIAHLARRHGGWLTAAARLLATPVAAPLVHGYAAACGRSRLRLGDPALLAVIPRYLGQTPDQRSELTLIFLDNILINMTLNMTNIGPFLGATLALTLAKARRGDLGPLRRLWVAWSGARGAR